MATEKEKLTAQALELGISNAADLTVKQLKAALGAHEDAGTETGEKADEPEVVEVEEGVGALKPDTDDGDQVTTVDLTDVGVPEGVPLSPAPVGHLDELPEDVKARLLAVGIGRVALDRLSVEFGAMDDDQQNVMLANIDAAQPWDLEAGIEDFVNDLMHEALVADRPTVLPEVFGGIVSPFGPVAAAD